MMRLLCSSGTAEQLNYYLGRRQIYSMWTVWMAIATSRRHNPSAFTYLVSFHPPNKLSPGVVCEIWRTMLMVCSVETIDSFWRQVPEMHDVLIRLDSWLSLVARRSPFTTANSGRSKPPLEPVLDWILEIKPGVVAREGAIASQACLQSDNFVVMRWLFDHGADLPDRPNWWSRTHYPNSRCYREFVKAASARARATNCD
jgi:hypothetical protein